MKRIFEDSVNGVKVVIAEGKVGFVGKLYPKDGEPVDFANSDLAALKSSMLNEAGKLHPDYFGFDGAKARFLKFFPDGFSDPAYEAWERNYKNDVVKFLQHELPIDAALHADNSHAVLARKAFGKNLLSSYENARIHEVLGGANGADFLRSAALFALSDGGDREALDGMVKAIEPAGRPSWPLVTYLPYFWRPATHMFLKPEATKDFSVRTGDMFHNVYSASLGLEVYAELQRLTAQTRKQLSSLGARDDIDTQSFIWVVGSYRDDDLEQIDNWREAKVKPTGS